MKKFNASLLIRFFTVITLIYTTAVSTMAGVLEVGASTISSESQTNSDNQALASSKAKTYNDTDPAWTYKGNWTTDKVRKALKGQFHTSNKIGNYATISIQGSRFTLIYSQDPKSGNLEIYVDGVKKQTISQTKTKVRHQKQWTSSELGVGTHVLKFTHATGKNVNIDAIQVYESSANPGLISTSNSAIVGSPTLVPSQLPNPTQSPLPAGLSAPTIDLSPTNPAALENPTSTLIPIMTSSPVPSEFVPQLATSTPSPLPVSTASRVATVVNLAAAASSTTPKVYYVSKTGNNSDGKSLATAWKALGQVNWNIIQPGDTINVSAGTYSGGILISKSGTATAPITIKGNGQVIIEGGSNCINAIGNYLKIQNFTCQHATSNGLRIKGTGTILENNTVRETYGAGIFAYNCFGCVIRGNRVTSFPNDGPNENRPYATDGIAVYESSNTVIEHNWIKITNQNVTYHIDGIQSSTKLGTKYENIAIQYNYVEVTKNSLKNSQAIFLTQMEGNVKIIGNVVTHRLGGQTVTSYLANTVGAPVNIFVVGNTIKCGGYRCLLIGNDDSPVIKNNIVWQTGSGQLADLRSISNCNPANINNNLYYAPNSSYPFAGSCGGSWADWHTKRKLDANGIFGQSPALDSCFRPTSTSPSIEKGAILTTEYKQGLAMSLCGSTGPTTFLPIKLSDRSVFGGSKWDIGAYEAP